VRALDEGNDVVIGSRNIPGGGVEGWGAGRHIISKGGSLYSRTILGLPIHCLTEPSDSSPNLAAALLATEGLKITQPFGCGRCAFAAGSIQ